MGNDYIPLRDSKFLAWSQNFAKNLKANSTILKLDSKKVTEIQSLVTAFKTALEKAVSPEGTRIDTFNKNTAKKELIKCIRAMVSGNLNYNPAITVNMRNDMGLLPRGAYRSKTQRPTSKPRIELRPGIRQLTIRYHDEVTGRRAKPKGVHGIVFHWAILNEPPESHESLLKTASKTSGPLILDFNDSERGKALYISAYWENSIGEPGPWCEIAKAYIA